MNNLIVERTIKIKVVAKDPESKPLSEDEELFIADIVHAVMDRGIRYIDKRIRECFDQDMLEKIHMVVFEPEDKYLKDIVVFEPEDKYLKDIEDADSANYITPGNWGGYT